MGSYGKDFRDRIFYSDGSIFAGLTKRNVQLFRKHCDFFPDGNPLQNFWLEHKKFYFQSGQQLIEAEANSATDFSTF